MYLSCFFFFYCRRAHWNQKIKTLTFRSHSAGPNVAYRNARQMEIVERPTQLNTEVHTYILRALGLQGQERAQHERLLTTECFIASKENIYPNPNLAYYPLMRTVSQSKSTEDRCAPLRLSHLLEQCHFFGRCPCRPSAFNV